MLSEHRRLPPVAAALCSLAPLALWPQPSLALPCSPCSHMSKAPATLGPACSFFSMMRFGAFATLRSQLSFRFSDTCRTLIQDDSHPCFQSLEHLLGFAIVHWGTPILRDGKHQHKFHEGGRYRFLLFPFCYEYIIVQKRYKLDLESDSRHDEDFSLLLSQALKRFMKTWNMKIQFS